MKVIITIILLVGKVSFMALGIFPPNLLYGNPGMIGNGISNREPAVINGALETNVALSE